MYYGGIRRRELTQMFKRTPKVCLTLSDEEYLLLRDAMLSWRNKLVSQGKNVDPVNELLVKLIKC